MKVLLIGDALDIHTQRFAELLVEENVEVHLASFNSSNHMSQTDYQIHVLRRNLVLERLFERTRFQRVLLSIRLGSTLFNPLYVACQIRRLAESIQPDLVHCLSVVGHTIACMLSGVRPIVVTAMGSDILVYPKHSAIARYAVRYVLRNASWVVSHGEALKSEVVILGSDENRTSSVVFGVNTEIFNPSARSEEIRAGIAPDGQLIVISTRRLADGHDVATLLNAVPIVLETNPNIKFVVAGEGAQRRNLERLSVNLGVQENVKFLGSLPQSTLARYLASSDIYVSTSLWDGMSISTMEAMASGLAPIVTDSGDNRFWIQNGCNGYIFPKGDSRCLASQILNLALQTETRLTWSGINISKIRSEGDAYAQTSRIISIYQSLIAH